MSFNDKKYCMTKITQTLNIDLIVIFVVPILGRGESERELVKQLQTNLIRNQWIMFKMKNEIKISSVSMELKITEEINFPKNYLCGQKDWGLRGVWRKIAVFFIVVSNNYNLSIKKCPFKQSTATNLITDNF